jgi:hypothetical protein
LNAKNSCEPCVASPIATMCALPTMRFSAARVARVRAELEARDRRGRAFEPVQHLGRRRFGAWSEAGETDGDEQARGDRAHGARS